MRRYYFPIFHNGETQADDVGELFHSAELAVQYGARVARDIAQFSQRSSQSAFCGSSDHLIAELYERQYDTTKFKPRGR